MEDPSRSFAGEGAVDREVAVAGGEGAGPANVVEFYESGQPALTLAQMRQHIVQVRGLLRGEAVEIDGGMAQFLASEGWLPELPITTPLLLASQGPRGRQLAHEIADVLRVGSDARADGKLARRDSELFPGPAIAPQPGDRNGPGGGSLLGGYGAAPETLRQRGQAGEAGRAEQDGSSPRITRGRVA